MLTIGNNAYLILLFGYCYLFNKNSILNCKTQYLSKLVISQNIAMRIVNTCKKYKSLLFL